MMGYAKRNQSGSEEIIVVEQVSKRFVRNEYRASLRHEAMELVRGIFGRGDPGPKVTPFYALKDITFSVRAGEAVGIVGRNGSGKTTLLRLLSNITDPTAGMVDVRAPYVSLIGLGAGFIPSLTGRENIYLNGTMLGMSVEAIDESIGAIIDFSELEDFIDMPANRYSSGMLARLGFSIAIHALTDIIFLDEVLAVGDAAFQEKCIERMEQVLSSDHTVLFVSHSDSQVRQICPRTIWLDHGKLMMDGPTDQVLKAYAELLETA
jgi:ABC-type polysaccharide/polyol phosphate transport system ATPase subunit